MSAVLRDERQAILDALVGDYNERTRYVPDRILPPAAFVAFGSPYLERREDDTFNNLTVNFEVWLVMGNAPNEETTDAMDVAIYAEMIALREAGFGIDGAGEPFTFQIQNANYLTAVLHVTTGVELT